MRVLLYLQKNTVNQKHSHLTWNTLGMTATKNSSLSAWELHMLGKKNTNSSRIPPQQNHSLKHMYLHEGLIFTRQCHFLIISKLITYIHFEKQGWNITLLSLYSSDSRSCPSLLKTMVFHNRQTGLYFDLISTEQRMVLFTRLLPH